MTPARPPATPPTVPAPDAVVIGGGIVGCSIALELARRGRRPLVLDKGPGPGHGSTSASSAIIRFNYSTSDAVKLAWESAQIWTHWDDFLGVRDELGTARFVRTGLLVLDSPVTGHERVDAFFAEAGIACEPLDAASIGERFPDLDIGRYFPPKPVDEDAFWSDGDGQLGGYFTPDAGFVDDPALAAHNLMVAAIAHGAEFRFRTEVTRIVRGPEATGRDEHVVGVELDGGEFIPCCVVVNAAGPHSSQVNARAGLAEAPGVRTRPLRQEVDVLPAPAGFDIDHGGAIVTDADLGTYFRPHLAGTLIVGGVEPDCDTLQWIDDPDLFDPLPSADVWDAQTTRLARRLPSLGVPPRPSGIAALYDVSDDWLPIYDRSDLGGFYLAIGTSGNQFKNAPMIGPIMADIIDACERGIDHDLVPVQVACPRTGTAIDAAHFSRRRVVHATSNSVLG